MAKAINISEVFPKQAFWDMDCSRLSIERDKAIIIPRVLMTTNEASFSKDIAIVESVYNTNEIYSTLKETKERISNNVCRMVSKRYKKPTFLRYKF
ncbi:DUF6922 domain-containing protein [Polaribacter sp. IC073]|uniref:DUF6922 domain-containing protein n=1 Tax=Polaribacter sp. IC073 TaxID=2508540 RepID=UPI0011BE9FDD|nr:hypothetical protein [Polaribacter sp. IC073]TXD49220.1 hypothetical protein ES045_03910 [Polaribacter sp. IC073]